MLPLASSLCALTCRQYGRPLLVLGGGGYDEQNTARCWTSVTAALLGRALDSRLPDSPLLERFLPRIELTIPPRLVMDYNTEEHLAAVRATYRADLAQFEPFVPARAGSEAEVHSPTEEGAASECEEPPTPQPKKPAKSKAGSRALTHRSLCL